MTDPGQRRARALLSDCCGFAMRVGGSEGTRFYVCEKCGEPCDSEMTAERERHEAAFRDAGPSENYR